MNATITRKTSVLATPRVRQLQGLFDVAPSLISEQTWHVDLPLPESWHVGVIVGPSGSGKSTIARELFPDSIVESWPWPADQSILDGFPKALGIKEITALLSSVGFSSPPTWVRPFRVLSNGQQFRVNLARTLAELPALAVVDEFTSVVDRTVAKIGAAAVAKTVRRRKQRFIAVTCHYDVLEWLEPDWIYDLAQPTPALAGWGSLQRPQRPSIKLEIFRSTPAAWPLFRGHHYLSADLHRAARCFVATFEGNPAAFAAVLPFPHPQRPGWREHRLVCLPDFQGVGIGNALSEFVASLYAASAKPYFSTTSHPSMIAHRSRSPMWKMLRPPSFSSKTYANTHASLGRAAAKERLAASFEFVGPARSDDARAFALV